MLSFKNKLFVDYPIPREETIWDGDHVVTLPVESIDDLIETCVEELASDVQITDYIAGLGMATTMPASTVTVLHAKLSSSFPFQGNRLVKFTYDKGANVTYLRYWPATICYRRKMVVEDLDNLSGDRLIYVKAYIHWKMGEKELNILRPVNMEVDNGSINLDALQTFKDAQHEKYLKMKEEIFLYSSM